MTAVSNCESHASERCKEAIGFVWRATSR
jgi:hypothetical protein